MSEKWNHGYPGDEFVLKAIWSVLEDAAKEKGMTLDEACKKAYAGEKPGHLRRAIGLNVKSQRGKVGLSRQQVSKRSGVSVRRIILVERGAIGSGSPTHWESNPRNLRNPKRRLRRTCLGRAVNSPETFPAC
jgi:hypothetical protein